MLILIIYQNTITVMHDFLCLNLMNLRLTFQFLFDTLGSERDNDIVLLFPYWLGAIII